MAREVYFDPFGNYNTGFREGTQDEQGVQASTRNARASDFDYNNLAPLRLNEAQRQDDLGAYGLPYQKQLIPIGVNNAVNQNYATNLGQAGEFARSTGIAQPYLNTQLNHFGVTQDNRSYEGPNGMTVPRFVYHGVNPDGSPAIVGQSHDPYGAALSYVNRPDILAERAFQAQQGQRDFENRLQLGTQAISNTRYGAQAGYYDARAQHYLNTPAPGSMAGYGYGNPYDYNLPPSPAGSIPPGYAPSGQNGNMPGTYQPPAYAPAPTGAAAPTNGQASPFYTF